MDEICHDNNKHQLVPAVEVSNTAATGKKRRRLRHDDDDSLKSNSRSISNSGISNSNDATPKYPKEDLFRSDMRRWVQKLLEDGKIDWYDVPTHFRHDKDVIMTAITSSTNNFSYNRDNDIVVEPDWLEDPELVILLYDHEFEVIWKTLPDVSKHDTTVICKAIVANEIGKWKEIPPSLQTEPRIALCALVYDMVAVEDVPWVDQDYVISVLQTREMQWKELPPEFQTLRMARELPPLALYTNLLDMLQSNSKFRKDHVFWRRVLDTIAELEDHRHPQDGTTTATTHELSDVSCLVERWGPQSVRADKHLMLQACRLSDATILYVEDSLMNDRDFFECLVKTQPSALTYLNYEYLQPFVDILIHNLPIISKVFLKGGKNTSPPVHTLLPIELFNNHRPLLEAWLRSGLALPVVDAEQQSDATQEQLAQPILEDQTIFLLVAEHCQLELRISSFAMASPRLRRDKAFMRQAMQYDPAVFACAIAELELDKELLLMAFGAPDECFQRFRNALSPQEYLVLFEYMDQYVHGKIKDYTLFYVSVLMGMRDPTSSFHLLEEQGVENNTTNSSCEFKNVIAEYLDAPTEKIFPLFWQAHTNLRNGRTATVQTNNNSSSAATAAATKTAIRTP